MFKKLLLTSFLLFSTLITIYPSKKENTNFFDYCYSLEKIISRNSVEKSNNLSKNFRHLAKDITRFGINKTKGTFAADIKKSLKKEGYQNEENALEKRAKENEKARKWLKKDAKDSGYTDIALKASMSKGAGVSEGIGDAVKKGVKRHKDAVEKKKIKNRKAVPYAALGASYEPEGEMVEGSAYGLWKGDGKRKLPADRKDRGDQKEFERAQAYIKKNPNFGKVSEAKVDKGRSDYGKATIRNWRHSGPSTVEPAMFDPENKRGKTIEKRREEHKARRGVKKAKVPAYKVNEEDKAFNYVVAKLRKQHGKDAVITKDNPIKPPTAAQKAKIAAHKAKLAKQDHRDPTEKASDGRYSDRYSNRGSD